MWKKLLLIGVVIGIAGGSAAWWYVWHKPHAKVEDAKGIAITATDLVKEYEADEKAADTKYLSSPSKKVAIDVSGTVSETETNQDGGLMVILDAGDPMTGVQCAMREKNVTVTKGQQVTIRGFCSGKIMNVSLTDCIMK